MCIQMLNYEKGRLKSAALIGMTLLCFSAAPNVRQYQSELVDCCKDREKGSPHQYSRPSSILEGLDNSVTDAEQRINRAQACD